MEQGTVKPRVVVVFNKPEDYQEMKQYAETKGLDLKHFFMWLAKSHMLKYPLKPARIQEEG
jgi:hypothetical protein